MPLTEKTRPRVLYVASGIVLPGNSGGSTHVVEVAEGLSQLGYEVQVMALRHGTPRDAAGLIAGRRPIRLPLPKYLSLAGFNTMREAGRRFQPDVVMERYYNFAGTGIAYAHRSGLPSVLEVNALMVDPAGTKKDLIDRRLLNGALRSWAVRQCEWATRIITPLNTTVPPEIPREKIVEVPWGANVDLFNPDLTRLRETELAGARRSLRIPAAAPVVLFSGSFRHWHGVIDFADAAEIVHGQRPDAVFLMVGAGPMLDEVKDRVRAKGLEESFRFTGAVPYLDMPLYLSLGTVGVAPFRVSAHRPLQEAGFYWSPLKVFEYMASGLPVVTLDISPLNEMVRSGSEGLLFHEGNIQELARLITALLNDPVSARRLGERGRKRVVERYSWRRHCERLDSVIREAMGTQ
jgi:alpha-maltose-1-phosphate synthase